MICDWIYETPLPYMLRVVDDEFVSAINTWSSLTALLIILVSLYCVYDYYHSYIVIAGDCGRRERARRAGGRRTYAVETTTVGKTNQNKIVGCDVSL